MKPTLYLGVTALAFGLISAPAQMQAALSISQLPSGITAVADVLDNSFDVARRGRGADDGPSHIRRSRGADDGTNHNRGDDRGGWGGHHGGSGDDNSGGHGGGGHGSGRGGHNS